MTNCTITLDVTGFGYTYLLQLASMISDFLEDGDNQTAEETLHDWMIENARHFADDARANDDNLAADIFSDLAADDEGGNDPEEEPANDDADDDAPENKTDAYDAVAEYLGCPEGEFLKGILAEASLDVKQDHTNLFKAGQFEGAARMLAAAIVNDGANKGESVATITRAVYDYCGLPW